MLQRGHAVDGARAHIDESRRPVLFLFSARRGTLLGQRALRRRSTGGVSSAISLVCVGGWRPLEEGWGGGAPLPGSGARPALAALPPTSRESTGAIINDIGAHSRSPHRGRPGFGRRIRRPRLAGATHCPCASLASSPHLAPNLEGSEPNATLTSRQPPARAAAATTRRRPEEHTHHDQQMRSWQEAGRLPGVEAAIFLRGARLSAHRCRTKGLLECVDQESAAAASST